jgi:hypothetical protein
VEVNGNKEEGNLQLVVNLQKENSSKDTAASSLGASLLDSEGSVRSSSIGAGMDQRRSSSLEAVPKPPQNSESSNTSANLPTVREVEESNDLDGETKLDNSRLSSKSRPSSGRQNPLVRRSPERKASERMSNSPTKRTGTTLSIDTEMKIEALPIHTESVIVSPSGGEPILSTAQIYGKANDGQLSTPIPSGQGISASVNSNNSSATSTSATAVPVANGKNTSNKKKPIDSVSVYVCMYQS